MDALFDNFYRPIKPLHKTIEALDRLGKDLEKNYSDPETMRKIVKEFSTVEDQVSVQYNSSLVKAREVQKALRSIEDEKKLAVMPNFLEKITSFIDNLIRIFDEEIESYSPKKELLEQRLAYSKQLMPLLETARKLDERAIQGGLKALGVRRANNNLTSSLAQLSFKDRASFWDQRYRDRELATTYTHMDTLRSQRNEAILLAAKKNLGLAMSELKIQNLALFDQWCMSRISKAAFDIDKAIIIYRKADQAMRDEALENRLNRSDSYSGSLAEQSVNMLSRAPISGDPDEDTNKGKEELLRIEKWQVENVLAHMIKIFNDYKTIWLDQERPDIVANRCLPGVQLGTNDLVALGWGIELTSEDLSNSMQALRTKLDLDKWQYMLAS